MLCKSFKLRFLTYLRNKPSRSVMVGPGRTGSGRAGSSRAGSYRAGSLRISVIH